MSKLILTRHGQSIWNAENRFTGWVDVDLSETGILEAKNSGQLIKNLKVNIDKSPSQCYRRWYYKREKKEYHCSWYNNTVDTYNCHNYLVLSLLIFPIAVAKVLSL